MEGWIKLDRELLESKVFASPNDLKIWVWLMLKASTTDRYLRLKTGKGCQTIEIKRGEMIFGRNKAEQDLKIDGSTVYRTLQRFQDEQRITIKANNQFSIITVNDFINSQSFTDVEDFEILEDEQPITPEVNRQRSTNEQPMNNQRAANEQPTNTVKEGLESKESLEDQKGKEGFPPAPVPDLFGGTGKPKNGKRKAAQEAGGKEIVLPFQSFEFSKAWANWKEYKAGEFLFKYKTAQSEQAALIELSEKSNGSEIEAIKIINQSMAKGWKGLFALKNEENGQNGNTTGSGNKSGEQLARGAGLKPLFTGLTNKYG